MPDPHNYTLYIYMFVIESKKKFSVLTAKKGYIKKNETVYSTIENFYSKFMFLPVKNHVAKVILLRDLRVFFIKKRGHTV